MNEKNNRSSELKKYEIFRIIFDMQKFINEIIADSFAHKC